MKMLIEADIPDEPENDSTMVDCTGDEIRYIAYDYTPDEGEGQLALQAGGFVKVFKITDSGWAAGILLDPETYQDFANQNATHRHTRSST